MDCRCRRGRHEDASEYFVGGLRKQSKEVYSGEREVWL